MKIVCNTALAALTLAFGLAGITAAHADTISVFGTGQSATGTILAAGATDSHYTLLSAPTGSAVGSAVAVTANSGWAPNSSASSWIGPDANAYSANEPNGNYDYRTTFTLTSQEIASTAHLSGLWTSDNASTIYLNGVNTGLSNSDNSYSALQAFAISSGFVSGVNTLDFVVNNSGGPTGLDVQISGTVASSSVTPEPSSLILLGTGVAGALTQVRRRFKA